MRAVFFAALVSALCGCAQNGYKDFYSPYAANLDIPNAVLLQQNEEPQIITTSNLDGDIKDLQSKRYFIIGISNFNGPYEDPKNAIAQAKAVGATVALLSSEFTNTETISTPLILPNNQTTYHSGSVYGGGVAGNYSGTSTTYGTTVVPVTSQRRRFDQTAVYFVKSTHKFKFGLSLSDLSHARKLELERNTGALVDFVLNDGPAFYANILADDVIISVDGQSVRNAMHGKELLSQVPASQKESKVLVIRKGVEREIIVKL